MPAGRGAWLSREKSTDSWHVACALPLSTAQHPVCRPHPPLPASRTARPPLPACAPPAPAPVDRSGNVRPLRRQLLTRCEKAFNLTPPPGGCRGGCGGGGSRHIACAAAAGFAENTRRPALRRMAPAAQQACLEARAPAACHLGPARAGVSQAWQAKMAAVRFVGALFRASVVPAAIIHGCLDELLRQPVGGGQGPRAGSSGALGGGRRRLAWAWVAGGRWRGPGTSAPAHPLALPGLTHLPRATPFAGQRRRRAQGQGHGRGHARPGVSEGLQGCRRLHVLCVGGLQSQLGVALLPCPLLPCAQQHD